MVFGPGQFGDVDRGVAERDQRFPAGQFNRIENLFDVAPCRIKVDERFMFCRPVRMIFGGTLPNVHEA
jgi:hypothetical protein